MSKSIPGNQKHLTLSDRCYIEQALLQNLSFRQMATTLHKDPSTISKEIRLHRSTVRNNSSRRNDCVHSPKCDIHHLCGNEICTKSCWFCNSYNCHDLCFNYEQFHCKRIEKAPFVCNGCLNILSCKHPHFYYRAREADAEYRKKLINSRTGINCTPEELEALDNLVSPLILKGQPLGHIYATHAAEISCSRRTLYNYVDQRLLVARNVDLPRRVRFKRRYRKSRKEGYNDINQSYRNRRTFKDFERFIEAHPDVEVVEMDTVKGNINGGKVFLTMLFRNSSFMLIFLLPQGKQKYVQQVFDTLTELLGPRLFQKTFPVILTDNGPEFKNPSALEFTNNERRRTYIFYCDPYVSNQKGRLEKNHEFIRYVLPKGKSFSHLTDDDAKKLTNHINSIARDNLNGATPFDLASLLINKKVLVSLGLEKVSPDEVLLKPALLKK